MRWILKHVWGREEQRKHDFYCWGTLRKREGQISVKGHKKACVTGCYDGTILASVLTEVPT